MSAPKKLFNSKKPSGPVKIGRLKIWIERDLCIGAATCLAIAPKTYDLDSEAKAIILESASEEEVEAIIDGARSCPTAAIIIENEDGERIYPK